MSKKNLTTLAIVGGVAVVFYLWNKSKTAAKVTGTPTGGTVTGTTPPQSGTSGTIQEVSTDVSAVSNAYNDLSNLWS
jgi:hypothetical protein